MDENEMLLEMKDLLKDLLEEYEGSSVYGCDLGFTLLERYNVDGTYTYSTSEAEKWIKKNFEDIGEIYENLEAKIGALSIPNPFKEPEAFQVCVMLEEADYMLLRCGFIDKNWNEEITLDKENIEKIFKELDMLDLSKGLYDIEDVSLENEDEEEM